MFPPASLIVSNGDGGLTMGGPQWKALPVL